MSQQKSFKAALLIAFILFFGLLIYKGQAQADYSAGAGPQTASSSSTLTLVVLPALESTYLGSSLPVVEERTIFQTFSLGVRANTAWSLSFSPALDPGRVYPAVCSTENEVGQRNTNNDLQMIDISCQQPISWADESRSAIRLDYQVQAAETLG